MGSSFQFCVFLMVFHHQCASSCLDDQCRELAFPSSLFFEGKRLVKHMIATISVTDRDLCEFRCYLEHNCVSINFEVKPSASGTHSCELNNSTHKEHEKDLERAANYVYHGTDNPCGKAPCKNNAICQSGFTNKRYRCLCTPGFTGTHCEHGPLRVTICEGRTQIISCQNGKRIDILNALYGRDNRITCPSRHDSNTNCRSQHSYSVVAQLCNNLAHCSLRPTNGMFGGDPCGGTYKYVDVKYQCV